MSDCTHDCSTCGESCGERKEVNVFEKKPLRPGCRVGKVYGVVSGKGGVGKSMVTSQLVLPSCSLCWPTNCMAVPQRRQSKWGMADSFRSVVYGIARFEGICKGGRSLVRAVSSA